MPATRPPARAGLERCSRADQPGNTVKGIVCLVDDPFRPIVDVEQDDIPGRGFRSHDLPDIRLANGQARIIETAAEQRGHRAARPRHHGGHQLGDNDAGIGAKLGKRGAQRKTHAQPADQDFRLPAAGNPLAGQPRQRLLGAAEAAVHQLVRAEHDREFGTASFQAELVVAVRRFRGVELDPWDHAREPVSMTFSLCRQCRLAPAGGKQPVGDQRHHGDDQLHAEVAERP